LESALSRGAKIGGATSSARRGLETILGDVLTWSSFSEPDGYHFNSLLIPDPDGNLCIDPVEPNDEVLSELVCGELEISLIRPRNSLIRRNRSLLPKNNSLFR
jgi:hypothetical protein